MARDRHSTEERRVEIADAALRLIGQQGIASLTVANLGKAVGLTAGALYRHFSSRESILEAAVRRVEELIIASFPDERLPPLTRLQMLVEARSKIVSNHSGFARLIFSEQFSLALGDKAAGRLRVVVERTREFIVKALCEAAEQGAIRNDISPEQLGVIVIGTIQSMAFLSAQGIENADLKPDDVWHTLMILLKPA